MLFEEGGFELPLLRRLSGHGVELDQRVPAARDVSVVHAEAGGQAVAAADGATRCFYGLKAITSSSE